MTQREVEKKANEFARIFGNAQKDVILDLLSASNYTIAEKERILAEIDRRLLELEGESNTWFSKNMHDYYEKGAVDTVKFLTYLGAISLILDRTDEEVIENLVSGGIDNLNEAISGMKRSSSKILKEAVEQKVRGEISKDVERGEGLRTIKGDVTKKILDEGAKLVDSAGRHWKPDAYAEMFARTELMNSYNQSVANQMLHHDQDLAYITSYAGCKCEICLRWQGKIVSISGKNPKYPSLQDAYDDNMFHPSCKHRLRPVPQGELEEESE